MRYRDILIANKIRVKEQGRVGDFVRSPRNLFEVKNDGDPLDEQIMTLLMNSTIRRGDGLLETEALKKYKFKVAAFIDKGIPIEIVFLGFPFKCHNPIETMRRTPDMGELAFLLRLIDINSTVKQVYSPGVKYTVLTEGRALSHLFGATEDEIRIFENRLREFISLFEAGDVIELRDLRSICTGFKGFDDRVSFYGGKIRQFEENDKSEIDKLMDVMTRSLPVLADTHIEDLLRVYEHMKNRNVGLDDYQTRLMEYMRGGAEELAISYMAFGKARKDLGVVEKTFPEKLYFSTTTKRDRYSFHPIHRRTRLYSHHGVPVLSTEKVGISYLKDVLKRPDLYVAVFCEDDIEDAPFYFLEGKQHLK